MTPEEKEEYDFSEIYDGMFKFPDLHLSKFFWHLENQIDKLKSQDCEQAEILFNLYFEKMQILFSELSEKCQIEIQEVEFENPDSQSESQLNFQNLILETQNSFADAKKN